MIDKFRKWLANTEIDETIKDLFKESLDCYMISAFKGAYLLSFVAFQNYLKDIITKSNIKDYNNKIFKTVKSNLNRIEKKEKKLLEELDKTKERDKYKLYGELLLAHQYLKPVDNSVKVINYYNNEEVSIPIDKSKSINYNSQAYYKKYRKLKNAVSHLTEQLELTKKEKIYFEEIKNSFEHASIRDIEEITIDLENNNYLIKNNKNKRKIKEYNYDVYEFEDYIIYVGKNHLQNDYITNKLAKPNDLWFHVKNGAGSHVVARGLDLEREEIIRNASLLASYYSSYKESSSVPVDYTYIKNIKKVPGIKGFFVTYTKEKTIYIDPRKEILEELKQFKKK